MQIRIAAALAAVLFTMSCGGGGGGPSGPQTTIRPADPPWPTDGTTGGGGTPTPPTTPAAPVTDAGNILAAAGVLVGTRAHDEGGQPVAVTVSRDDIAPLAKAPAAALGAAHPAVSTVKKVDSPRADVFGGWLEYSGFGVRRQQIGTGHVYGRYALALGDPAVIEPAGNPWALPAMTWTGIMTGTATSGSFHGQAISGVATVTFRDGRNLSGAAAGAVAGLIDIRFTEIRRAGDGAAVADMAFLGVEATVATAGAGSGGFSLSFDDGGVRGAVFGDAAPDEVAGVFERTGYIGAFGAELASSSAPPQPAAGSPAPGASLVRGGVGVSTGRYDARGRPVAGATGAGAGSGAGGDPAADGKTALRAAPVKTVTASPQGGVAAVLQPGGATRAFGGWLRYSGFGVVAGDEAEAGQRLREVRYALALGDAAAVRPAANPHELPDMTWTGHMTALEANGAGFAGATLFGNVTVTFRSGGRNIYGAAKGTPVGEIDIAFSNVRRFDGSGADSGSALGAAVTVAGFTGVPVTAEPATGAGAGRISFAFAGGGPGNSVQGGLFGTTGNLPAEAAGVFERSGMVGAFGAGGRTPDSAGAAAAGGPVTGAARIAAGADPLTTRAYRKSGAAAGDPPDDAEDALRAVTAATVAASPKGGVRMGWSSGGNARAFGGWLSHSGFGVRADRVPGEAGDASTEMRYALALGEPSAVKAARDPDTLPGMTWTGHMVAVENNGRDFADATLFGDVAVTFTGGRNISGAKAGSPAGTLEIAFTNVQRFDGKALTASTVGDFSFTGVPVAFDKDGGLAFSFDGAGGSVRGGLFGTTGNLPAEAAGVFEKGSMAGAFGAGDRDPDSISPTPVAGQPAPGAATVNAGNTWRTDPRRDVWNRQVSGAPTGGETALRNAPAIADTQQEALTGADIVWSAPAGPSAGAPAASGVFGGWLTHSGFGVLADLEAGTGQSLREVRYALALGEPHVLSVPTGQGLYLLPAKIVWTGRMTGVASDGKGFAGAAVTGAVTVTFTGGRNISGAEAGAVAGTLTIEFSGVKKWNGKTLAPSTLQIPKFENLAVTLATPGTASGTGDTETAFTLEFDRGGSGAGVKGGLFGTTRAGNPAEVAGVFERAGIVGAFGVGDGTVTPGDTATPGFPAPNARNVPAGSSSHVRHAAPAGGVGVLEDALRKAPMIASTADGPYAAPPDDSDIENVWQDGGPGKAFGGWMNHSGFGVLAVWEGADAFGEPVENRYAFALGRAFSSQGGNRAQKSVTWRGRMVAVQALPGGVADFDKATLTGSVTVTFGNFPVLGTNTADGQPIGNVNIEFSEVKKWNGETKAWTDAADFKFEGIQVTAAVSGGGEDDDEPVTVGLSFASGGVEGAFFGTTRTGLPEEVAGVFERRIGSTGWLGAFGAGGVKTELPDDIGLDPRLSANVPRAAGILASTTSDGIFATDGFGVGTTDPPVPPLVVGPGLADNLKDAPKWTEPATEPDIYGVKRDGQAGFYPTVRGGWLRYSGFGFEDDGELGGHAVAFGRLAEIDTDIPPKLKWTGGMVAVLADSVDASKVKVDDKDETRELDYFNVAAYGTVELTFTRLPSFVASGSVAPGARAGSIDITLKRDGYSNSASGNNPAFDSEVKFTNIPVTVISGSTGALTFGFGSAGTDVQGGFYGSNTLAEAGGRFLHGNWHGAFGADLDSDETVHHRFLEPEGWRRVKRGPTGQEQDEAQAVHIVFAQQNRFSTGTACAGASCTVASGIFGSPLPSSPPAPPVTDVERKTVALVGDRPSAAGPLASGQKVAEAVGGDFKSYYSWGHWSRFQTTLWLDGTLRGEFAFPVSHGFRSAGVPTRISGSATWTGAMSGVSYTRPDSNNTAGPVVLKSAVVGDVTATMTFSDNHLDLDILNIRDFGTRAEVYDDITWDDIDIVKDRLSNPATPHFSDAKYSLRGSFYGPNQEEIGGIFNREYDGTELGIVGAFGAGNRKDE